MTKSLCFRGRWAVWWVEWDGSVARSSDDSYISLSLPSLMAASHCEFHVQSCVQSLSQHRSALISPPTVLLVINNGFHQSACIFHLGFLHIDHSTHSTLLSSCQLSSETSSNHFLSIDILSGQEWFLCGIQKMPQWSLMSVFEANQKSLSPQIFIIFLPSSVLSQALVGIFAEYLNTSS